jgi:hypothetical protein
MSPELGSLAWQTFYSGSRCTGRLHQDRFRFDGFGLGSSRSTEYITRPPACRLGEHHRAVDLEVSFVELDRPAVGVILYSSSRQGDGESLGEGGSVGESLGEGGSVGESLGEGGSVGESLGGGDSVGESLGEGSSVGESLGEGEDVSLADGSVAVDVGAGG